METNDTLIPIFENVDYTKVRRRLVSLRETVSDLWEDLGIKDVRGGDQKSYVLTTRMYAQLHGIIEALRIMADDLWAIIKEAEALDE